MTTLAEHTIMAGAENRPPMLEKSMYGSWASRIRLFIKGKKHGRMMLDSIDNGPLVYPTVEEDGQTRPKKYSDLTEAQQLQDDCDVQATNIILHGLPPDVYALFLNALPPEWSKFVTDVKLAKSLYTTNYDQLYAYLSQHERHAQEVRVMCERYPDPLALLDCDDISLAKAVLMANLSSCDSDILSEESQDAANLDKENQTNTMVNESLTAELERYKERVAIFEQRLNIDLNKRENLIDSQMDDLIRNRNAKFAAFQQEIDTHKETLSNQVKEKESLSTTLTVFKTKC
ncbi:hypothetical protein Tco_0698046 [Tanacetum coccineum]